MRSPIQSPQGREVRSETVRNRGSPRHGDRPRGPLRHRRAAPSGLEFLHRLGAAPRNRHGPRHRLPAEVRATMLVPILLVLAVVFIVLGAVGVIGLLLAILVALACAIGVLILE